jgi:5-methylcytosine-specific restriction endonuclease McrA
MKRSGKLSTQRQPDCPPAGYGKCSLPLVERREYQRLYSLAFPSVAQKAKRKWNQAHKEHLRQYARSCYRKRPTLYLEYSRLLRLAFPERYRETERRKYLAHGVRIRARSLMWAKENPGKANARGSRHRALKNGQICLDKDAVARVYARCQELRRWFDVCVDHIIPLAKGGAHAAENLQIIYSYENAQKNMRLDYRPSVIFV